MWLWFCKIVDDFVSIFYLLRQELREIFLDFQDLFDIFQGDLSIRIVGRSLTLTFPMKL